MFISRKKYEADLEAARREGAEKVWEQQRMDSCMREVHQRIDGILDRLSRLEPKPVDPCQCNTCNSCSPLPY